mgnify:CR=1 FL=1
MFKYNIINETNIKFDLSIIDNIFLNVDKIINICQKWILNIVFVDKNHIKILNGQYRQKDSVTDVLSFHYYDDFSLIWEEEIAWELIFCEDKIISQAVEYGLWEEKEFYKLLIHSILHILWYDHENDNDYQNMQPLEDMIWKEVIKE